MGVLCICSDNLFIVNLNSQVFYAQEINTETDYKPLDLPKMWCTKQLQGIYLLTSHFPQIQDKLHLKKYFKQEDPNQGPEQLI